MDYLTRFLDASPTHGDERSAVNIITALDGAMRCNHKDQKCRIRGVCGVHYFKTLLKEIEEHPGDNWFEEARELVRGMCASGVERPGCMVLAIECNIAKTEEETREHLRVSSLRLKELFDKAEIKTAERQGAFRSYIDDSQSFLHLFFVPHDGVQMAKPIGSFRMNQFLILVYPEDYKVKGGIYQWDRSFRRINDQYLSWGNEKYPGRPEDGLLKWTIWVRPSWRVELSKFSERAGLYTYLSMDEKFINKLNTREGRRFYFQKFGVEGSSMEEVAGILMQDYGVGRSIYEDAVDRHIPHLSGYGLPMLLIRSHLQGNLNPVQVSMFFFELRLCQMCYIEDYNCNGFISIDTRAHEMLGRNPIRLVRPIRHIGNCKCGGMGKDAECTCRIDGINLNHDEMISRQGDHWVAINCLNADDALLVVATMVHRFFRGSALNLEVLRRVSLASLARCVLYWGCSGDQIQSIFKLLCYTFLDREPDMVDKMKFFELGYFLEWIMTPQPLSLAVRDEMIDVVTQFSIAFIQAKWWKKPDNEFVPEIVMPMVVGPPMNYSLEGAFSDLRF
uniref:Non-structural protein NS1 n=1 Tax=Skunk River virus TaxID=2488682 RepID=A0A3S8RBX2_9REOV|nr:NS1 [Skunk River virus]